MSKLDCPDEFLNEKTGCTDHPKDRPTDRLTDRQTDRPTNRPTDWPTDRPTDWLTDWPIDWPTDRPTLIYIEMGAKIKLLAFVNVEEEVCPLSFRLSNEYPFTLFLPWLFDGPFVLLPRKASKSCILFHQLPDNLCTCDCKKIRRFDPLSVDLIVHRFDCQFRRLLEITGSKSNRGRV